MARKPSAKAAEALDRAQDLVYDAWEAATAERRGAIARQALAISPLCADAYGVLARDAPAGSDEALEFWRRGVEAGKAALGDDFDELRGSFWGFIETRPYMRARIGLAQALWARGEREEAIGHVRDMLELNPGDNQGVRYGLAAYLVELGRHEELERLFQAYPEDGTVWQWTKALMAFQQDGDSARSRSILTAAMRTNRYVLDCLTGARPLPMTSPAFTTLGGEDEAISYVEEFAGGWRSTPGAIDWLRLRTSRARAAKRRSPRPQP
jgi:tetratricopeptide (TPR) repeat protein